MKPLSQLLVLRLDQQCYGLRLAVVERVLRVVEITPLPKAPDIVMGVINLQGQVLPVLNLRERFRLPEREMNLRDQLIIARTAKRTVALVADEVSGIVECPEKEVLAAETILPAMEYVEGVIKLEDGLLLIHNLDRFLSLEETEALDEALGKP